MRQERQDLPIEDLFAVDHGCNELSWAIPSVRLTGI